MSTRARKAATWHVNSVNDELVGEEDGDIVDAPGHGEFGARPRGDVAVQNMVDVDEGGENGENTSDIIGGIGDGDRGSGERGVNGDVSNDGGLGGNAAQSQVSRPDTDHRG